VDSSDYRPWRTDPNPDAALLPSADQAWRRLLSDSRKAVDQLSALNAQAAGRIELGARLLRALHEAKPDQDRAAIEQIAHRLAAVESRLDAIERRLDNAPPVHMPRAA
jgi:hypothetical protein